MNRYDRAESLGFSMMEIDRRWGHCLPDREDEPLFIFTAGREGGARELSSRVVQKWRIATDLTVEQTLFDSLAQQLIRVLKYSERPPKLNNQNGAGDAGLPNLLHTISAQADFLRSLWRKQGDAAERSGWGVGSGSLTGDYAPYLRLLFPRAKFVFLHRNPRDSLRDCLAQEMPLLRPGQPDANRAASFAQCWCTLVASFQLWHGHVGGILIGYDDAVSPRPTALEGYLGVRLLDPCLRTVDSGALRAADERVIVEHTREIAVRCGYDFADAAPVSQAAFHSELPERQGGVAQEVSTRRINCAVLVPTIRYIEPECEETLAELERRGYAVKRVRGCTTIDRARSMLATLALDEAFDETLWVDADTDFDPEMVERVRSHGLPIVAGVYAKKRPQAGHAVAPLPGTRDLLLGEPGGLVEVLYAGTGFLLVRSEVYRAIKERFGLPLCDRNTTRRAFPFFMPMLEDWGGQISYLGEDYAFCRRARFCGYKIMADTSIRLWHIGTYRYGYEDAAHEVERLSSYRHRFSDQELK